MDKGKTLGDRFAVSQSAIFIEDKVLSKEKEENPIPF